VQGRHAGSGRPAERGEYIANSDILNKLWVEAGLGIDLAKDRSEVLFWPRVFEPAFAPLSWIQGWVGARSGETRTLVKAERMA
jgi:hypothetical protein